jgi:transposase-like protein
MWELSNRFQLTSFLTHDKISGMGQDERPTCPECGELLVLTLPPNQKGKRRFQCFDCERPDPLGTDKVMGWLKSELQPPK